MAEDRGFPVYGGWKTVRKIGSGSFGAVYEIERELFGVTEKAALKQISIPRDESDVEELYANGYDDRSITAHYEGYLAEIVREYQLMLEMKGHTNVVYCDDIRYAPRSSGVGWDIQIKMELLQPLMKHLDQVSSEEQIRKLARDMASALVLCRSKNIIHRDIKPQNMFLSKDGDFKLGDFGIAKTVEKTSGGTKIGTYNYMAPEVYNNRPYGHTADIYSLGLVLYWLLNERRLPFYPLPPAVPTAAEMDSARLRRFQGEAIPAPLHGSRAFQDIVLKACAFEPGSRYQNAEELLRDLNALKEPVGEESGASGRETDIRAEDSTGGGWHLSQQRVYFNGGEINNGKLYLRKEPWGAEEEDTLSTDRSGSAIGDENETMGVHHGPGDAAEEDGTLGYHLEQKDPRWRPEQTAGSAAPASAPEAHETGAVPDAEEKRKPAAAPEDEGTLGYYHAPEKTGQLPEEDGTVGAYHESLAAAAAEEATVGVQQRKPGAKQQEKPVTPVKHERSAEEKAPESSRTAEAVTDASKKPKKKGGKAAVIVALLAVIAAVLILVLRGGDKGDPFSLSDHQRSVIGDKPALADTYRVNAAPDGTVPYTFGLKKEKANTALSGVSDNTRFFTMSYNMKKVVSADDYYVVLRTEPDAGAKVNGKVRVLVELTKYPAPKSAVYFQPFYNSDTSISKGIYLDKDGDPVRFVEYYYSKLSNGHSVMKEAHYSPDGKLVDLWTHEYAGEGYLLSTADPNFTWMKQTRYTVDGKVLSVYIWEHGAWREG